MAIFPGFHNAKFTENTSVYNIFNRFVRKILDEIHFRALETTF